MKQKSKTVAAVLAILLGALGVHRFYVGKIGSGIAMLLLSASVVGIFVTAPWALVDAVMILLGKFHDRNGNLLQ